MKDRIEEQQKKVEIAKREMLAAIEHYVTVNQMLALLIKRQKD